MTITCIAIAHIIYNVDRDNVCGSSAIDDIWAEMNQSLMPTSKGTHSLSTVPSSHKVWFEVCDKMRDDVG